MPLRANVDVTLPVHMLHSPLSHNLEIHTLVDACSVRAGRRDLALAGLLLSLSFYALCTSSVIQLWSLHSCYIELPVHRWESHLA